MPQMNPMNWNLIFMLNLMNTMMFISLFYFIKFKKKNLNYLTMKSMKLKILW